MNTKFNVYVIIISVSIYALTYGLSSPLIALQLKENNITESIIGINAAMHALGVFTIAPFLPYIFNKYEPKAILLVSLSSSAILIMLFQHTNFYVWFLLRFGIGVFTEIIMVLTETWISDTTTEDARGKTIALYTAGISLGFAIGPLILLFTGTDTNIAFVIGFLFVIVAMIFVYFSTLSKPFHEKTEKISMLATYKIAAVAILATVLNSTIEVMGMNFLALYAVNVGWDVSKAITLISVLMFGAIILQIPIGWLSDKIDRLKLVFYLSVASSLGALIWPFSFDVPIITYTLLFIWGGLFVGIYTVTITWIGSQYSGNKLSSIFATMSVAWGVGALLGPVLGGAAMELTTHGIPLITALLCLLFSIFTYSKIASK
ncbi:MFS transporter [Klebsiella pneumoniae]|uniref:MFS transporter n=2 Tax=Klebsiella pneumoniae TaxID=573 RepID=UPI0024A87424|nr:MFS transporter [Klebsiella pneumoniae]HDO7145028.1 MFS transporter [Klebsiella pneumoniae]HDO7155806.1 MFS transporter [Klebsiella pneumoniae]